MGNELVPKDSGGNLLAEVAQQALPVLKNVGENLGGKLSKGIDIMVDFLLPKK